MKYCFSNPQVDYMQFLEECRKVEDEDKVGQVKLNPPKPRWQQPQYHPPEMMSLLNSSDISSTKLILWWVRSKTWCQLLKPQGLLPEGLPQVGQECLRLHGEEVQGGIPLEPLPSIGLENPRCLMGLVHIIDVDSVERWGI